MQDKSLNLSHSSAFITMTAFVVRLHEIIFALKSQTCSSVTWSEWRGCVGGLERAWVGFWQLWHSALLSSSFVVCAAGNSQEICPLPVLSAVAVFRGSGGGLQCVSLHPWRTVCSGPSPKKHDYFCSTPVSGHLNLKSRLKSAVECSSDLAFDSTFQHSSHFLFLGYFCSQDLVE